MSDLDRSGRRPDHGEGFDGEYSRADEGVFDQELFDQPRGYVADYQDDVDYGEEYDADYPEEDYDHPLDHAAPVRRRRRWIGVVVLLLILGLVGGAGYFGFDQVRQLASGLTGGGDYPGPGTGSVEIVIKEGDSGRTIGKTLETAGVVKSSKAFVDALGESGANNSMQPGTYKLRKEMSGAGAVALLQSTESRVNIVLQVREGLWKSEVFALITKETGFTTEQLTAAAKDPAVGLPAEAGGDPEGYLFPATYTFNPDVTPVEVLRQMVAKYTEEMTKAGIPEADRRRVLIIASLVQAEASQAGDFPKVARVVENRLAHPPGTLGFDTTVNFAVQKRGFDLTQADLDVNSPYNTRKVAGLPPGPIDSPGAAAIEAAQQPAAGDWLYFVTVNPDTGETVFTSDYNTFLAAKDRFNEWYAQNKDG